MSVQPSADRPAIFADRTARVAARRVLLALALAGVACGTDGPTDTQRPATALGFTTQPVTQSAGATIEPAVVVTVRDAYGNTVSGSTAAIALTITHGTGSTGATLRGTLVRNAIDGRATFDDLSIDEPGAGYTLTATAAGLTAATTTPFEIAWVPGQTLITVDSDEGEYVGDGRSYRYTQEDAAFAATIAGGSFRLQIHGNEWWYYHFQSPDSLTRLTPGMYTGLATPSNSSRAAGGMEWAGESRICNATSSVIIDHVAYTDTTLVGIDLRFTQQCGARALRGTVQWNANDPTSPPGPALPIPDELWAPPADSIPAAGGYVYLSSEYHDFIGQGRTYTYTPESHTISISAHGRLLSVLVDGWKGFFQSMTTLDTLEPGYYGGLRGYPFHNPVRGGLYWFGNGRACNRLVGWFAIDAIIYEAGQLTAIEMRFAQHCEGAGPALRGAIRWTR